MGFLVDSFVGCDIVDFNPVILLLLTFRTNWSCAVLVQIEQKMLGCYTLRNLTVSLEDFKQMKVLDCYFDCHQIVFSVI